ncbi:MAG: hypothetical protein Q7U98_12430 [Methylicorpusculum sp.]|uniref:hypothetical protein n=1 Tax=Methylicorpusculum sp. TaxID=2713644 RepID=UPI0027185622|nr:hypothetical protein [Methylicorpusculum sp.]MDO8939955.1 hypothetical protein [Methylicorpusculum sp.]MDO9238775.1 hypothetical protein [Methylicorpusculum sp.]MDP2180686.1 hypothetical protein [Methylicorpusculum sp.]
MTQLLSATATQADFTELLCQEFLSSKGYGAFAFLSAYDAAQLFTRYSKQNRSDKDFIKDFVRSFVSGRITLPL